MKKSLILTLATLGLVAFALFNISAAPTATNTNDVRVANLVEEMQGLSLAEVENLSAIPMQPYTLPTSSVDVMRVRLEETYTVEGVGEDTVELAGWIVVRHGAPSAVNTANELAWGNFVVDTEFVGLKLQGESEIFGPVEVMLDADRPAIGQVGSDVALPNQAQTALASYRQANTADEGAVDSEADALQEEAACNAPVNVVVNMPELNLSMKTEQPAIWHSQVTTIPPVGHEASVTVEPVTLVQDGRQVGTLVSGTVKFREVVRKTDLVVPKSSHSLIAP